MGLGKQTHFFLTLKFSRASGFIFLVSFIDSRIFRPHLLALGLGHSLMLEAVLCIVGRLAASLASHRWMPVAHSPDVTTKDVSRRPKGTLVEGKIEPG